MGGTSSSETQHQWVLEKSESLRVRIVSVVRGLYPAYKSFRILDDEVRYQHDPLMMIT